MDSMIFPPAGSQAGILHYIPPNLSAFEPSKVLIKSDDINTLIWIGGMYDTFMSVSYPFEIGQALGPTWSLVTTALGSAGLSWGVSSIAKDAEEIGKIVAYFREKRPNSKIVLMGHSTGCQDCMEYVVGKEAHQRPAVDGIILQGPVSDREAIEGYLPVAVKKEADELALKMCRERNGKDALPNRLTQPLFGSIAITASRWVDISSPGPHHTGADDLFSSDLSLDRLKGTFGKMNVPLLILYSGEDESRPKGVDMAKVTQKWIDIVKAASGQVDEVNSGILPEATHNLNGCPETVVQDLVQRVASFVTRVDRREFGQMGSNPKAESAGK